MFQHFIDELLLNRQHHLIIALLRRGEKERLMNRLVSQERVATDKNLLGERNKTDLEAERSADLLNAEHAEHLKTKSALTTREEFVAIVSHDLRNPIGAVLSAAEILLEDSSPGIGSESRTLAQLIKRNAETSLRLIRDILEMERIVEGKFQLQLTENRIDDLIRDSVEGCSHVAATKNISLQILASKDGVLSCDRDRVAQILSNLIGNAVKFTPENGSITVATQESENEIRVSIQDTGPGIPYDQKTRIFERFAQLGNQQRGGIGLGLYISKTLAESHSGNLGVTSEPGLGSTFWFTLPKEQPICGR